MTGLDGEAQRTKGIRTKQRGHTQADLDEVSDNAELTKEDFAQMRPFAEVFPHLAASIRRSRGQQKAR